jgi:hypothetical protein
MSATLKSTTMPMLNFQGTFNITISGQTVEVVNIENPPVKLRYLTKEEETKLTTYLSDPILKSSTKVSDLSKKFFTDFFDLFIRSYASYVVFLDSEAQRYFFIYKTSNTDAVKIALTSMIISKKYYEILYDNLVTREKNGEKIGNITSEILSYIIELSKNVTLFVTSILKNDPIISSYGSFFMTSDTRIANRSDIKVNVEGENQKNVKVSVEGESTNNNSWLIIIVILLLIVALIIGYKYLKKNKKNKNNTKNNIPS